MKLKSALCNSVKWRTGLASLAILMLSICFVVPLAAHADNNSGWSLNSVTSSQIFRHAAIGTAAGAGAGILSDKTSIGRGAVVGGVTGAGSGVVGTMDYLKNKPLLRNTAQGAVIGTGTGYALRSSKWKGAVIGAGAGAGTHYVRRYINDRR
ncbi:MAG: hypothetical protein AAGI66_05905 [Cyanobacteria bacterium P01_H01_bin.74]